MEKVNIENAVQNWINTDSELSNLLVEIEQMTDDVFQQAEIAFHKVSEKYNVAKMPTDIDENYDDLEPEVYVDPSSVYEQLGYLKFLYPHDDIRSLVMLAIYFVKDDFVADIDEVLQIKYGDNPPEYLGFGFKGINTNVELVFVTKNESWFDLGCNYYSKYY